MNGWMDGTIALLSDTLIAPGTHVASLVKFHPVAKIRLD